MLAGAAGQPMILSLGCALPNLVHLGLCLVVCTLSLGREVLRYIVASAFFVFAMLGAVLKCQVERETPNTGSLAQVVHHLLITSNRQFLLTELLQPASTTGGPK